MESMTVEVIADGLHLPPELLRMIVKTKGPDYVCMVTDSLRVAGTDITGEVLVSKGRDKKALIEDGVAKLMDRSAFAGSIATSDRLVRVMWKEAGIPLTDCIRMMSATPARVVGLDRELGTIHPGKRADFVVFDDDVNVYGVMVGGKLSVM
jgi:N-acetylglucosamine-6-phosphate deacetylase